MVLQNLGSTSGDEIGEMEPACYTDIVREPVALYREFLPCEALRAHVSAIFSFAPAHVCTAPHRAVLREVAFQEATFCSPQFADGHVSMVFELGRTCDGDGRWAADSTALRGTVNGPMSGVGRTEGSDRPEMIGIYFRPAGVAPFLRLAISDLADRAVMVEALWGTPGSRVAGELCGLAEGDRIAHVESALLARLGIGRWRTGTVDVARLAAHVMRRRGRVTVEGLAHAAGVSRQHLTREFRAQLGIGPKLYTRIARFQSGLVYAGCRDRVAWADAAVEMGYADQSHMIAEFRQFSALTPAALASREWFHPFIERARDQASRYSHVGSPACRSRRFARIEPLDSERGHSMAEEV
jgi:AraC-like DNA-binding protein